MPGGFKLVFAMRLIIIVIIIIIIIVPLSPDSRPIGEGFYVFGLSVRRVRPSFRPFVHPDRICYHIS